MPRENPPITTMMALLEALYVESFCNNRKTMGLVRRYGPSELDVWQYFDDGKGHSGAFSATTASLDPSVFKEAQEKGFVTGVLKLGYVSTYEFKIAKEGEDELFRLFRELETKTVQAA